MIALVLHFPTWRFVRPTACPKRGSCGPSHADDGSLWLKVGGEGIETKVVDGTLWVRSCWAIVGYLNADNPFDDNGWLNTRRIASKSTVSTSGFLGRETDIINVGGNKVYPAEVESVLLEDDNVRDAVVYGVPNPLTGQVVAAQVVIDEKELAADVSKRLRTHVAQRLERFKIPSRVEIVEATEMSARCAKSFGQQRQSRRKNRWLKRRA